MKANSTSLLDFLSKPMKLSVPIYQRPYSWDKEQCEQLWNDIMRVGGASEEIDHFTGCIVLMPNGAAQPTAFEEFLIIDGQQRLTTVTLLLIALERLGDKKIEGLNPRRYIQNQGREGSQECKLELSNEDKYTPSDLLNGANPKKGTKLETNLGFFKKKLKDDNLEKVCKGLARLNVVSIILDSKRDDPQLVFESMNATGKGLSQADLIRNYALMGLEPDKQEGLYKNYWRKMEEGFQRNFEQKYSKHLNDFVRYFLTMKTKCEIGKEEIYEKFKSYHRNICEDIEEILREMKKYSEFYNFISLGRKEDPALSAAFKELIGSKSFNVEKPYPLLLKLYDQYYGGNLKRSEFEEIVHLMVSYLLRRTVCGMEAAKSRVFVNFIDYADKGVSPAKMESLFGSLKRNDRFPDDDEFREALQSRKIYALEKRCNYLLTKLENSRDKSKQLEVGSHEIEHIMPQSLTDEWKRELGGNASEVHGKYLDTLGNLTLAIKKNNLALRNKPFKQKRDMEGGFAESSLRIASELKDYDRWSEGEIKGRAKRLAEEAIKIWKAPSKVEIRDDDNKVYRYFEKSEQSTSRPIFEALREEIFALDMAIENSLEKHISYDLGGNKLYVNPLKHSLKVCFGAKIDELKDPENKVADITGNRSWGTGNALVELQSPDDIPYLMDLINQALEQDL